jgi:UDP-N-acetylglucosamine--dolichyl-phosphate N-acetylglucosaminephosphotransferase
MKRIIEHNQIKGKPVEHTEDFKLKATEDRIAPVTLVRLIIAKKPMSEKKIVNEIFKLTFFSGGLAILTAIISVITTNG